MNKKFTVIFIISCIIGYLFYSTSGNVEAYRWSKGKEHGISHPAKKFGHHHNQHMPSQHMPGWELPSPYAQTSWPSIHRDSRNSDYLPFVTTDKLASKWHALKDEHPAVLTPIVTGPEGNLYFTTGQDDSYGNLHAFDSKGNELWRSDLLDNGAICSAPLIGRDGDLYLGDADEFFSFHPDGTLKWRSSAIEGLQVKGAFPSTAFTLDGYIVAINMDGRVYVFDPHDGHLAANPLDLPGTLPTAYKIPPPLPAGLWQGMVSDGSIITKSDLFNGLLGYQFKITNTPVVNPVNGRIYAVGTIISRTPPVVQGRFYGVDFIPGSDGGLGELQLAFESAMGAGSGSSPAISPDGSHIYVPDGVGSLYAFDLNGNVAWTLQNPSHPTSPGIGPDGTIYTVSGSKLQAITDSGNSGSILWQKDLAEAVIERLPGTTPAWIGKLTTQPVTPEVRCNSAVVISKNHLYLTLALGYAVLLPGKTTPTFFPMSSFLMVLTPPDTISRAEATIDSLLELPDTTESLLSLDKNGLVFCAYGSVNSSIAYGIYQILGANLKSKGLNILDMGPGPLKPIGGLMALGPENQQDLTRSQLTWVQYLITSSIDDSDFRNSRLKPTLMNKISEVLSMIDQGLYHDAQEKLSHDILTKTDGCIITGAVDKNDWIVTCEDQDLIYPIITEAVSSLAPMWTDRASHKK